MMISWDSVRRIGQRATMSIFAGFSAEEARWLRGPGPAPPRTGWEERLTEAGGPVRITLAPDVDPDDPLVERLVSLDASPDVNVVVASEVARKRSWPITPKTWTLSPPDKSQYWEARWQDGDIDAWTGLTSAANFKEVDIDRVLTDASVPGTREDRIAYFRAVQFHHRHNYHSHLFVTSLLSVIQARTGARWPWAIGQCTPGEALVVVGLFLRHRDNYTCAIVPGSRTIIRQLDRFGWYTSMAQRLVPHYLPYFWHVTRHPESTGNLGSPLLDYLEGIQSRLKQALSIHDHLGWLHLREIERSADNARLDQQSEAFYAALQALGGALEGLAGLLVLHAGTKGRAKYPSDISLDRLVRGRERWTRGNSIDAYRERIQGLYTPLLEFAAGLRGHGYHEYPLIGQTLLFGRRVDERFVDELRIGAIRPATYRGDLHWIKHGTDGLVLVGPERLPFILPWLFIRAVLRDLVKIIDAGLELLIDMDSVAEDCGPSKIAERCTSLLTLQLGLDTFLPG